MQNNKAGADDGDGYDGLYGDNEDSDNACDGDCEFGDGDYENGDDGCEDIDGDNR